MVKKTEKTKTALPSKATSLKPSSKKTPVPRSKPERIGRGEVKASILSSLATGPKSREQLIKAGNLSLPSFYLNLRKLRESGQIVVEGRKGLIKLTANASGAIGNVSQPRSLVRLPSEKPDTQLAVIPQFVSGELHDALQAVNARFIAMDRVGEKLHTLEQLSRSLPSPVAAVLMSIHSDLLKLSPARATE